MEESVCFPSDAIPPGGIWPFEVVFDPAGMEGPVEKSVWVTLAPSKETFAFEIAETVRLRLGFKPMEAAFGVVRRSETWREMVATLAGYAAGDAVLGNPRLQSETTGGLRQRVEKSVFDVCLGADGKSVVAKFCDGEVLPGLYAEMWTVPTSDAEIPEIRFAVSARVAEEASVTPQVLTVGWDEPTCSRMVMVRGARILSAETKPCQWGEVTLTPRPMNGWRIDIEGIDPREVRQFSENPFLEVKTDLPGMESIGIPLRVTTEGEAK